MFAIVVIGGLIVLGFVAAAMRKLRRGRANSTAENVAIAVVSMVVIAGFLYALWAMKKGLK